MWFIRGREGSAYQDASNPCCSCSFAVNSHADILEIGRGRLLVEAPASLRASVSLREVQFAVPGAYAYA